MIVTAVHIDTCFTSAKKLFRVSRHGRGWRYWFSFVCQSECVSFVVVVLAAASFMTVAMVMVVTF